MSSMAVWWHRVADGSHGGMAVAFLKLILAPVALLYGLALRLRGLLYQLGILTVHRLPCPVISIGNITVGGTGKTPATILVAQELQQRGCRVAVLSRGYGGTLEGTVALVSDGQNLLLTPDQCGDEPCLLAGRVPGLEIVIGADRYRAGLHALEKLKPDILLLDDGFQHIRLHRDLNILLLDGTRPFGNGWSLPLGLLREPLSALKRADMVVFTRCRPFQPVVDPGVQWCRSEHSLSGFNRLDDGKELAVDLLRTTRVAAFAGIADPAAFFESLRQLGIHLTAISALPDHEPYCAERLSELDRFAAESAADWLITTEKDGVKLVGSDRAWSNKVVTARLDLLLEDAGQLLHQNLDKLLSSRRRVGHTVQSTMAIEHDPFL